MGWQRKGKFPATLRKVPEVKISPAWCWFQQQLCIWFYVARKWNEKSRSVVVTFCCFCFELLQIFFYNLKQNLIFGTVKPSFTNKLLSRHHCHWFPQCQEEWLHKWSPWWSLRLRVCNKQPEHHSRLLILSSLHLGSWGDNTARNILLAIWYFCQWDLEEVFIYICCAVKFLFLF